MASERNEPAPPIFVGSNALFSLSGNCDPAALMKPPGGVEPGGPRPIVSNSPKSCNATIFLTFSV